MSVTEVAQILVKAGAESEFVEGMNIGAGIIAEDAGCVSVQVLQGVEEPRRFALLIDWNSIEEHETFRNSPRFADYRATISEFLDGPPSFSHFDLRIDLVAGSHTILRHS